MKRVSLAGRWWPNTECWLVGFVDLQGIRTNIAKKPYILGGGGGPDPLSPSPPLDPHMCFNFQSYLIYTIEAESMCLKETDQLLGEELESVSSETLHKYMCLGEYSTTFFPEGRVLVNSVPFKLISSNVQFILKDEHTTSFSDIHNTTDGLLSFGTLYRVQSYSYQYTINIYGNDLKCLRRHLMRHLMELKSKASGSICILMPVRKDFPCETVDSIFSELGFERQNKLSSEQAKPWITCDFLFERKL